MVEEAFVNIEDLNLNNIFLSILKKEDEAIIRFAEKIKKYPKKVRVYVG